MFFVFVKFNISIFSSSGGIELGAALDLVMAIGLCLLGTETTVEVLASSSLSSFSIN